MLARRDSAVTTDAELVPLCPFLSMVPVLGGQCFGGSSLTSISGLDPVGEILKPIRNRAEFRLTSLGETSI